eukprot:3737518-Prymnesium_polylepis.1
MPCGGECGAPCPLSCSRRAHQPHDPSTNLCQTHRDRRACPRFLPCGFDNTGDVKWGRRDAQAEQYSALSCGAAARRPSWAILVAAAAAMAGDGWWLESRTPRRRPGAVWFCAQHPLLAR